MIRRDTAVEGAMDHVRVRDLDISYEMLGDGYPLVLMMGLTASMDWWHPELVDTFAQRYRVLLFDNRGAGRTVTPDKGDFSIEQFADDTVALMKAKGIERANVVSMSMGGMIAQELALKYPERINKLVLSCTSCGGEHSVPASHEVLQMLVDLSGGLEGLFGRVLKLMYPKDYLDANPDFARWFYGRFIQAPSTNRNAARQFMACVRHNTYSRLPKILPPTLVACGAEDILIPPQNSRMLAERIPGAQLIEYPGTGHGFMTQAREAFSRDVLAFFAS